MINGNVKKKSETTISHIPVISLITYLSPIMSSMNKKKITGRCPVETCGTQLLKHLCTLIILCSKKRPLNEYMYIFFKTKRGKCFKCFSTKKLVHEPCAKTCTLILAMK